MVEFKVTDPSGTTWSVSFTDLIMGLIQPNTSNPEREFFDIYSYLKSHRSDLSHLAMEYYKVQNPSKNIQPIKDVNLIGDASWIPSNNPIDLNFGNSDQLELKFSLRQPIKNNMIYTTGYLPWSCMYVENIQELNKRILEKYNSLKESRPVLFDAPIYQLLSFNDLNGTYNLSCCRSDYFSYMDNCELLFFEFARAVWKQFIIKGKKAVANKIKNKHIPIRKSLDIFNFQNRCVGIGINTIFLMKDGNKISFFKHKRAPGATMEAINTEHVVPAGTFQPRTGIPATQDIDFDIYKNILRELGEELLGKKDMEEIKTSTEDITKDRKIKEFHNLVLEGYAKAFFLGWGMDPLTTKAEFLTAFVVNIQEFKKRFGEPQFKHNWEGEHYSFSFDKDTILEFVNGPYTLPAGAGCAKLAWKNKNVLINSVKE